MITYQLIHYANNYTLEGQSCNQALLKFTATQLVVLLLYRMKNKKHLEILNYVQ